MRAMNFDVWWEKYKPLTNPVEGNDSGISYCNEHFVFETFGKDIATVQATRQSNPDNLWTVLDCDGKIRLAPGYHHVNRLGYAICTVPYTGEFREVSFM